MKPPCGGHGRCGIAPTRRLAEQVPDAKVCPERDPPTRVSYAAYLEHQNLRDREISFFGSPTYDLRRTGAVDEPAPTPASADRKYGAPRLGDVPADRGFEQMKQDELIRRYRIFTPDARLIDLLV